ncbi:MAG: hypothetical protein PHW74_12450, partial [Desulfobacca sp.]|nr:hypothetical protein [Desulfobacca sp.]
MRLFGIDSEGKFKEYRQTAFPDEHKESTLETWLEKNSDGIIEDGKVLIIGRQVPTNLGGYIDLLGIDRNGNIVVIELKRDRTPRETLAQALEYSSFAERLDSEQLENILHTYSGEEYGNIGQYHREYFELSSDEAITFNKNQRIVIVGQKITPEIRQTAIFLRSKGISVTCLEFCFFQSDSGLRLLSTEIVVGKEPPPNLKVPTVSLPRISEAIFTDALDQYGKQVFVKIFELAKTQSLPLHWGTKGFSLNVNLQGIDVPLCYGYPPDCVFKQSIYTGLVGQGGTLSKVADPQT